jgi:hypothetical protein
MLGCVERLADHASSPSAVPLTQPVAVSLALVLLSTLPVYAEVRVVTAQGEYRMGDRDTREDAVRLATEAAKRNALEQVATYLESVTVVSGMDVTRDEIRTYSAGLVLVLDQQTTMHLEGDDLVVAVDLVAQIDTEEVSHAIAALRANEDARVQLTALEQENAQLQHELDAANQALASAATTDQIQSAAMQRQEILNRVQSNAMVSQAWTDWVLVVPHMQHYPGLSLVQTRALLNVAQGLSPGSPHVTVAQQVMAAPPEPPRPPAPATPGSASAAMPTYSLVPGPTSAPAPKTLNEVSHATSSAPPRIGNQPDSRFPPADRLRNRSAGHSQQSNRVEQSPPPSGGAVSRPLGARPPRIDTLPGGSGGPPPAGARRLPPTINQLRPPIGQPVPRVPYRLTPHSPSGGQGSMHEGHGGRGGSRGGAGAGRGR